MTLTDLIYMDDDDIDNGCFDISINDNIVTIECDWDYGWGGRGREVCNINIDKLEKLINSYKELNHPIV